MNFTGLLFLILTQYISGRGFVRFFKLDLKPVPSFCLANITGVMLFSFIPFILQLCYIPITFKTLLIFICTLTLLLSIGQIVDLLSRPIKFKLPAWPFRFYELPFIAVLSLMCFTSVWRCFYLLTNARDTLSGPEVIAEYAVREKTMLNSVFTINLETTNNHLKPPFITCLQIIYKLFVQPIGQLWLSVLFLSFIIWLYHLLKEKLHPIVGGVLMLLFMAMPELFGHTSLVLFDYSNMILFFAGFYFLAIWLEKKSWNYFAFATALFGFATYIRTDTLLLIALIVPLLVYNFYKMKVPVIKGGLWIALFIAVPAIFYFVWINIYLKYYMPVHFTMDEQLNHHLGDISGFFIRLRDMTSALIFNELHIRLFGYFMIIFVMVLCIDIAFFRKFNKEAVVALYGIALVYFGLAFMGYLIPLVDILNTTKRGLFKMLPLMLLYMRNSGFLTMISQAVNNWEFSVPQKNTVVNAQPVPAYKTPSPSGAGKRKNK